MDIKIIKVGVTDLEDLLGISRKIFFDTFSPFNTKKDIDTYMNKAFAREQLKKEIATTDSQFYFACFKNKHIGYLKINTGPAQTELREERGLEIERIYVLSEFHGRQIGQALLDKALQIAQNLKKNYLWLGVWEQNRRAVRFYEKNAFVSYSTHIFKLGEKEQTDLLMRRSLK